VRGRICTISHDWCRRRCDPVAAYLSQLGYLARARSEKETQLQRRLGTFSNLSGQAGTRRSTVPRPLLMRQPSAYRLFFPQVPQKGKGPADSDEALAHTPFTSGSTAPGGLPCSYSPRNAVKLKCRYGPRLHRRRHLRHYTSALPSGTR
jgi:hypothetical protein